MARPRDETIDLKVVRACVALLEEHGRSGLSRARIAARAGVSLPAVNRRFADVDEILLAVTRVPGSPHHGADLPAPDSLRAYLVGTLTALARAFARDPVRRAAAELLAAKAGHPGIDESFRATLTEIRAEGLTWVEHAKGAGQVAEHVDGDLLLDLVTGSAYYRLLWRSEAITEGEVAQVVDLVLRGAAPTH
ncbi:TetR/AcrR family transcriptional regulator [Nocardioides plantarum]|uniref:TetR/AcrR family transcriptional regulator n=1 Tax=Nocardioides plantarum TaxID=29299 RepID=A0ABV5K8D2_9ACTN|nr:TetR/AcrR family transcriptional regulator [Nocardioides plantarum]